MKLINGRFRYADAHDMYALLGVKSLPIEGMPERLIDGVRVYVKPLPPLESIAGTRRRRRFALRVMAICECGRHLPVGRMHQHKCERDQKPAPVVAQKIIWPDESSPDAELLAERDALQDSLLRMTAEFDNYRKRTDREQRDRAATAVAGAVKDLFPVIDNLERALQTIVGTDRRGLELVHSQMMDVLRRRGVTPIDAVGADFDPRFHEAVVHEVSADHRDGEVTGELSRGYMLGDRLLRAAGVRVAKVTL